MLTLKLGAAILISDKANFRERKMFRDVEEYYIMLKGSILQGNKTILHTVLLC